MKEMAKEPWRGRQDQAGDDPDGLAARAPASRLAAARIAAALAHGLLCRAHAREGEALDERPRKPPR